MTSAREEALKGRPEGGAEDEGTETVLDWLALYMPSWGTSIVLHVAVLVLAAFVTRPTQADALPFDVTGQVLMPKTYEIDQRSDMRQTWGNQQESRGTLLLQPSSLVQMIEVPVPDVASNDRDPVWVIGVGGGGAAFGGFEGLGTGPGRGSGLFGVGGDEEARKIVYVVDRSGSMTSSIDYVKLELKRSIGKLGEEKEFHIIFYSSGPPVEMPTRRLVNATERNKAFAYEFVDGIIAQGETDPSDALRRAFAVRPEVIYLLTDGEFDKAMVDLDSDPPSGEEVMKIMADQNGGNYKAIYKEDLATLMQ
ncbi:MAG: VWA domain-containing protein [Planctomycetota bacterium]|nr:VWA domain-containing protein [Planctomycetota bacterium]